MAIVRAKGFAIWQDRKAPFKWRCRHRKTGTMIDLGRFPLGSLAFFAECARIVALVEKAGEPKPGTLGQLIARYRGSPAFLDLSARTRSDYQKCLDYLQPIADTMLDRFTTPLVVRIRDKATEKLGRKWGNYVKTVLALLFAWGLERGYVRINPALNVKGIRRPKNAPEANRPWTDVEREAVMMALPGHMRLPFALMMYLGLDPQDALKLPRTAILDGKMNTAREKTAVPVWLPLPGPLLDEIKRAPQHNAITLCANSRGRPWTGSGFRSSWRPINEKLKRLGLVQPGLTPKGLRHTVATILREMGKDYGAIKDMLGQRTEAMARHYSRRADMSKKNTETVADFEVEMNKRRTKSVKPT